MPGKRQPTDLVIANGKKHLSTTEEAERRSREARVPPAKTAKPPKWLDESLKKEFRALGKRLIAVGLYTDLDADTLGMYLTSRSQWELASREVQAALTLQDADGAGEWSKIQDRFFKAARSCAADLGLSVSARCKLQIPQAPPSVDDGEDEFSVFLRQRQQQQAAGG